MPATFSLTTQILGLLGKPYGVPTLSQGSAVAFGHFTSPFITAYPWTDGVGFGTKYANPATLPPTTVNGVTFSDSPSYAAVFLANNSAPAISAYAWSTNGFGTKFADPASAGLVPSHAIAWALKTSGAPDWVGVADQDAGSAIFVGAWRFTAAGWGTKYTNPATLPTGAGQGISFQKNRTHLAVAFIASPFINAYPFTASGFGVKRANAATLAPGAIDCAFSRGPGFALGVSHAMSTTNVTVWPFNNGFGTIYADASYPVAYPDSGQAMAFAPLFVVLGTTLSASFDQFIGWRFDETLGFQTRFSQLPYIPQAVNAVAMNESGSALFASQSQGVVRIAARRISTVGYGAQYTNPGILPTGAVRAVGVAF